ncbi:MAG TPA: outer membrane beta-barrel protein [Bacteroidales bacterium]|nr:outer membrane beta-barrel protein [Bacteroidales bacterium]HPT20492.1 outer membrane beta-barrel protein [Bacteroidales bacterium]
MKLKYFPKIRQYFAYVVLLLFSSFAGYSQETGSCAEKLKTAQSLFDKGQVELVPSMLSGCIKSGFTNEESLSAYKLLIQSYLFEDKLGKADSTMMAFLRKNPEYHVSPTDHSSFVHLYNNFNVRKVVQLAFHFGTSLPFITFIDTKTAATIQGEKSYSTNAANLFTSLEAKININKKLEINLEAGYSQLSFTNSESFMGFKEIIYKETQKRIEIPVTFTYDFLTRGNLTAYARLGEGVAFNLRTMAQPLSEPIDINNPNTISGADINRDDSRTKMDIFTQAGAGVKYKIPRGFVFVELRSNLGILNQTIRNGESAEELRWLYNYVDDDFNINSLNISIGVSQIFFKPTKRKQ